MEEHPKDHLSLDEASELVHSSKSTVSHLFKKITGKSFKRYQIELKLDRAQRDLRTIPGITVSKVAYSLGYTDPLYFSRLYKKHKRIAPSEEKPMGNKK
jgi:AraC-like DNA-binding protein